MKFLIYVLSAFLVFFSLTVSAAGPVDINTASADEIAKSIKGIGPKKAAAIVEYRNQHGPFKSIEDLRQVKGIGPKILEANKTNLTVGGSSAMPTTPATTSMPSAAPPATKPDMHTVPPAEKPTMAPPTKTN